MSSIPESPAAPQPKAAVRRKALAIAVPGMLLLAVAGYAGHYTYQRIDSPRRIVLPFDANRAMDLAGEHVPPEIESFYFFILDSDAPVTTEADELAVKMAEAAEEQQFLGITGADPEHNYDTVVRAVKASQGKDLRGLVVIYLGPPDHEPRLNPAVSETGAEFHFIEFPQGSAI